MIKGEKFDLQERLVSFSAEIIKNVSGLNQGFASQHLSRQLIRSATSSALNYGEAQSAESRRDFVHKMKLCLKELRESQVNLQILEKSNLIKDNHSFDQIILENNELVAIFTTSIKTSTSKT